MVSRIIGNAAVTTGRGIASASGVGQDDIIFGMILLAFVIYITVKGELRTYMAFFTPQKQLGPPVDTVTTGAASTSSSTPTVSSVVNSIPGANLIPGISGNSGTTSLLPSWMTQSIPSLIGKIL